jgi:hypothetical protein
MASCNAAIRNKILQNNPTRRPTMPKKIIIKSCEGCPFCTYQHVFEKYVCTFSDKKGSDYQILIKQGRIDPLSSLAIPNWCPLNDDI